MTERRKRRKPLKTKKKSSDTNFVIAHISDLHLGWNKRSNTNVETILNRIGTKYQRTSHKSTLVVTGDIWNSYGRKDKQRAKVVFKSSKIFTKLKREHVLLCPGNHDNSVYYRKHKKEDPYFFPQEFPCLNVIDSGNTSYYFIGLDSAVKRTNKGKIGTKQVDFLNQVFETVTIEKQKIKTYNLEKEEENKNNIEETEGEEEEEKESIIEHIKVIIYLHHHPFLTYWKKKIEDDKLFRKTVAGKCDVLLFGHYHKHRRLQEEEKKYKIPVILASGKSANIKLFREIRFLTNGKIEVKDIHINKRLKRIK